MYVHSVNFKIHEFKDELSVTFENHALKHHLNNFK